MCVSFHSHQPLTPLHDLLFPFHSVTRKFNFSLNKKWNCFWWVCVHWKLLIEEAFCALIKCPYRFWKVIFDGQAFVVKIVQLFEWHLFKRPCAALLIKQLRYFARESDREAQETFYLNEITWHTLCWTFEKVDVPWHERFIVMVTTIRV